MPFIFHLICVSLLLVLTSLGGKACAVQELVTLTMAERAGVSRQAEWVTIGVPLPKGKIRSTEELCVLQNGQVIDAARIRDEQVIETHERGLCVTVEGEEYRSARDPNGTLTLEEKGPLHAVLRATGSLRNSRHEKKFDYDCRLYAYAGSPEVRFVVSLINRQGKDADFIPLSSFFLELPTTITTGHCRFGAEGGGIKTGSLSNDPEADIYQVSSSEHIFGGAVKGKGGGKQTKPTNIGWGYLSGAKKGIGVGVRWFWQLHPKSIELTADGVVRVGLFPSRHKEHLKFYTGVARTHEVRFCFDSGDADASKLKSTFAGLQQPLRPFAPPKWYCRDTQALGDYCESGGAELYGPFAEKVAKFDEAFELANRRCQAFRDSRTIKGVETDSYGFLGFGDGVHHV